MAFIPVPGAAQGFVSFDQDGQLCQCEFDFAVETDTIENLTAGANLLHDQFVDKILPHLSSGVAIFAVGAFGLATDHEPQAVVFPDTPEPGGTASPALPNNVALCVTKRTALRGKSYRGRAYLPGIPDNARDGISEVSTAYLTSLQTGLNGFLAQMIGGGFPLVVISRYTGGAPRTTGIATPVTQLVVRDIFLDSQRRRLPGRGR